jgi:hypothetical protein
VQASYDLVVSIVGDWSRLGRRGNQLTFVNLEAGYTILENFIYDEETDRTWFSATRADWDGSSPDFHFILNHPTPSGDGPSHGWWFGWPPLCSIAAIGQCYQRLPAKSCGSD